MQWLLLIVVLPTFAIIVWALKDIIWLFLPTAKNPKPDKVNPIIPMKQAWQRFLARIMDLSICGFAFGIFLNFDVDGVFENIMSNDMLLGLVIVNICLFYEISCLASFETTIGKKLMGVRLSFPDGSKDFAAVKRPLLVWYRGVAGGYPIISLFTMYAGLKNYRNYGKNSWDITAGTELTCEEINISRWIFSIGVTLALYGFAVVGFILEKSAQ